MMALYERKADDVKFRRSAHPSQCKIGWEAWLKYLELLKQVQPPRTNGGAVHASSIASDLGWDCDRFLALHMMGEEESPTSSPDLERCFDVGHGMEFSAMNWTCLALQLHYGDRLVLEQVEFQRYMYRNPVPAKLMGDIGFLTGSMDMYVQYVLDGMSASMVIDYKSTAVSQTAKRKKPGQKVEPEAPYVRQVTLYMEPQTATSGAVVYWEKQWPHTFYQSTLHPRPSVYADAMKRIRAVDNDIREGRMTSPTYGSYCAACTYRDACKAIGDTRADGS